MSDSATVGSVRVVDNDPVGHFVDHREGLYPHTTGEHGSLWGGGGGGERGGRGEVRGERGEGGGERG